MSPLVILKQAIYNAIHNISVTPSNWTEFTPSVTSKIVYVSADGDDASGVIYTAGDSEIGDNPFLPVGEIMPFATYAEAYANTSNESPDWILMKRGDTFYESIGSQVHDGVDASNYSLIGSYGDSGNSPVFKTGADYGIIVQLKGMKYIRIMGLDFYAHTRDPENTEEYVNTLGEGGFVHSINGSDVTENVLIEGCKFRFYRINEVTNFGVSEETESTMTDFRFFRCVFLSNYSESSTDHQISHAQGMWSSGGEFTLEECIFDHNGWYTQPSLADNDGQPATIYNHNTYFYDVRNTTLKNCNFLRPSSINNKWTREHGCYNISIENNLYVDGEVGIGLGGNYTGSVRHQNIVLSDNVFTNIGRSQPTERDLAWGVDVRSWKNGEISNNIIMNQVNSEVTNVYAWAFDEDLEDVEMYNNIVYNLQSGKGCLIRNEDGDWSVSMDFHDNIIQNPTDADTYMSTDHDISTKWTFTGNKFYGDILPDSAFDIDGIVSTLEEWNTYTGASDTVEETVFPDTTRSIETYMSSIGEIASIEAFIDANRNQDRYNWDERYMADSVNTFIRAGFYSE